MVLRYGLSIVLSLALGTAALPAPAQEWSPIAKASGWASFDLDGTCTFFEPVSRRLINWGWETGTQRVIELARTRLAPEKWVLDSLGNAWVVQGTTLQFVDKAGKTGTSYTLPAEVGDLAWDATTFILSFKAKDPYLEKRDLKTGSVVWTFGAKPPKGAAFAQNLHRIAVKEDGEVLLTSGPSLAVTALDGTKGKVLGAATLQVDGAEPPALALGGQDRGALIWWLGTNMAMAAVPGSQLPARNQPGLLLARMDFTGHAVTFIATSLSEDHALVGMLEQVAVFRAPAGGLVFYELPH